MPDDKKMALYIHEGHTKATVQIGDGSWVPDVFSVRFRLDGGPVVEIELRSTPGKVRATEVSVMETDDDGITGLTISGVRLAALVKKATSAMAFISTPPTGATEADFRSDVRRSAEHSAKATRRRVSDDRLHHIAEIIEAGGDVADVMEAEGVGQRQAFRLIARAKGMTS